MTLVVVPVRYPLSEHSRRTLETAIDVADEHDAALTVLHVDLYQSGQRVTQSALKDAVEDVFGPLSNTRYAVRPGFLVEETILDEIALEDADVVVIGRKQASRWRRMVHRLIDEPDVGDFLREQLDCRVVTAPPAE
jgi:nucleotide-binding universal stress UspA family protein